MNTKELQGIHEGKPCVIIANGPGLNDVDLDALKAMGYVTIGLNRIYKKFTPDYLVSVNDLVLEQWSKEILATDCVKVIPERTPIMQGIEHLVTDNPDPMDLVVRLKTTNRKAIFQKDLTQPIWEGHTVTYVALQLARWMGMRKVYLVGLDHWFGSDYSQNPNQEVVVTHPEKGHFDEEYFPAGSRWNLPDLKSSEVAYILAAKNMEIYNFSTQTAWRGFPLQNLNILYENKYPAPTVSAVVSAYKARSFLKGCLEDLMEQTLWDRKQLEIVLVCKENSREHKIIQKYTEQLCEGWWQLVLTDDVPTVYEAWNLGLKQAKGMYFTNANSDDRHHEEAYEVMAAALDTMPHIDLVYHNDFISWKKNETFGQFIDKLQDGKYDLVTGREKGKPGYFAWPEYTREALSKGCFIGPHPMWRASVHQLHGWFDERFQSAGDYEFWLRIAKEDNFYHLGAVMGLYHANPKGIELGDVKQSGYETLAAWELHQNAEGLQVQDQGEGRVRLQIGDKYCYNEVDDLIRMVNMLTSEEE